MDFLNDFWRLIYNLSLHSIDAARDITNFLINVRLRDERLEHLNTHQQNPFPEFCPYCAYELERGVHSQPRGFDETDWSI